MKKIIKYIMTLILLLILAGCVHTSCPSEKIYLKGSIYCNEQFKDIFTEIEEGELDNPDNYLDKEQWEKIKKEYIFDEKNREKKNK